MCTSIAWANGDFYFGRNLDLEVEFNQQVVIAPRQFEFCFRQERKMASHYAMIGMATVLDGQPLYAEVANEKGLCMAGLNFPQNAWYPREPAAGKANITPFELPWWVLGQCSSVKQVRELLQETHIIGIHFSETISLSPLHWHIADKRESIVLECCRDGMHVLDNPIGVLTNNPTFDFHMNNLCQYMNLTPYWPENRFSDKVELHPFGRGLGAFGLPGDASPASRFVRAAFFKLNAACKVEENASVAQFMHVLDAVAMPKGSVIAPGGEWEHTLYTCCVNADKGIYYYKTYGNSRLTAVNMHHADLDGDKLACFPLMTEQSIHWVN